MSLLPPNQNTADAITVTVQLCCPEPQQNLIFSGAPTKLILFSLIQQPCPNAGLLAVTPSTGTNLLT